MDARFPLGNLNNVLNSGLDLSNCVGGAQFITVFLGSFIAGSFLNQARELINNPTSIISTLGTSAPLTSIFFLTFIELNVRHPHIHSITRCSCKTGSGRASESYRFCEWERPFPNPFDSMLICSQCLGPLPSLSSALVLAHHVQATQH